LLGTQMWPMMLGIVAMVQLLCHSIPFPPVYSLSYAGCFLPCFAAGLLFPTQEVFDRLHPSAALKLCGIASLICYVKITQLPVMQQLPWKDVYSETMAISPLCEMERNFIWSETLFNVLLGTLVFLVLLVSICPREEVFFTSNGRDGALYAYLLHTVGALQLLTIALSRLPLPTIESAQGHIVVHLARILLCACVAFMCSSAPAIWLFKPFFQPKWHRQAIQYFGSL